MSPFWIVMLSAYVLFVVALLSWRVTEWRYPLDMNGNRNYFRPKERHRVPLLEGEEKFWAFAVPFFVLLFAGGLIYNLAPTTGHEQVGSFNIVALGDSSGVGGRRFIGAGSDGRYQTYAFMYRTQDGGFKMGSRQATYSTIYEDAEPNTARIDKWVGTNGFIGGWTDDMPTYRIHIPPNSVVQGYNVDVTD